MTTPPAPPASQRSTLGSCRWQADPHHRRPQDAEERKRRGSIKPKSTPNTSTPRSA